MSKNGSPLTFPMRFPLKVIGYNTAEFKRAVRAILSRHVPGISEAAYASRASSNERYLAITATFVARSRAQLDAIYQDLNHHESVVTTL